MPSNNPFNSPQLLVTGGGGLLGHALKEICPNATFLSRADGDLTDQRVVETVFAKTKPTWVVHLAAKVGGVKSNALLNADYFTVNSRINLNVLDAAQKHGVERLISILSSCAFFIPPDRPATEDDLHVWMPYLGNLGYAYSKRLLDVQSRVSFAQHGVKFSTLTPVTMYGPNDNWDLEDGHVVGALIHKCALAKKNKEPLTIWGSGRAVRQFIFSGDVARVIVRQLASFESPETVIIAPDEGITIADLAVKVAAAMDFKGEIHFDASKPEGQLRRVLKSAKFPEIFPGFTFTPLDAGLTATAEWFRRQL
jgi:GDP-L-fucose synthase